MKHEDIWRALDTLAAENGLSASGLARRAGLDATTFNPSKRRMPDGRPRWPSTESLSKVLEATGASLDAFSELVSGARALSSATAVRTTMRRIPLIGLAQAGDQGFFDDGGYPVGGGWDEVSLPEIGDPNAYALEISGDSMEPVFRHGDMVIVSPAAPIRRGDRVVARTGTRRSHGQATRAAVGETGRPAQSQSRPSRLQLRPCGGQLDASHHMGQPIAPSLAHAADLYRPVVANPPSFVLTARGGSVTMAR